MNRLFDIAKELGEIARQRYQLRFEIANYDKLIVNRKRALIPVGGWPGSNDTQRKAAELQTIAADEALAEWDIRRECKQNEMDLLEVQRDALIAERDAWQWTIRDEENQACGLESVFVQMMKHETE